MLMVAVLAFEFEEDITEENVVFSADLFFTMDTAEDLYHILATRGVWVFMLRVLP